MLDYEDVQEILTQIADEVPGEIYKNLNGGIILSSDLKEHPDSAGGGLYTLGEYKFEPTGLGRYIVIYYGSLAAVYGSAGKERLVEKLREVLYHELTHHLEHMAGDRSLERKDEADLSRYRRGTGTKKDFPRK